MPVRCVTKFEFHRVSLRGGWSGRVLTGAGVRGALADGVDPFNDLALTRDMERGSESECREAKPRACAWDSDMHRMFADGEVGLPTIEQWRSLLERIVADPSAMSGHEVLKHSSAGEVFRAQLAWDGGSLDVVCKQTRVRGFQRRLISTFRATRERANFDRALTLLRAGVATALPLALLEGPRPRRKAWLITARVPNVVDLDQVALTLLSRLEPNRARAVKNAITQAVVELLDRLERHGLRHRDLKASNILMTNWDGSAGNVQVWIMDLEGLRIHRSWDSIRRWQPLIRLPASLIGYAALTRGDYVRFLRAYLARAGLPVDSWRDHYRALSKRATDYAKRAQLRKTHKLDGYTGDV